MSSWPWVSIVPQDRNHHAFPSLCECSVTISFDWHSLEQIIPGIIEKKQKEILWLGLPTNSAQECKKLDAEKRERLSRISQKTQQLYDILLQHIAYKSLVERNKVRDSLIRSIMELPLCS